MPSMGAQSFVVRSSPTRPALCAGPFFGFLGMTDDPVDKRTETISFRTSLERAIAAKALAEMDGHSSISDLMDSLLAAHIQRKRSDYLQLRAAFEVSPDLPRGGA